MGKNKKISIIIPTFNRLSLLKKALSSISSQTYKNVEIIIIDDGSTDGTLEFLSSQSSIKYRCCIQNGPGINRKLGLELVSGDFVIFMDDDDFYTDFSFFEKAINIFKNNHSLALVNFLAYDYESDGSIRSTNRYKVTGLIERSEYFDKFMGSIEKPRSTFCSVFSYNKITESHFDKMTIVNDTSIYLRILLVGDAFLTNEYVGMYRIHPNNLSKNVSENFIIANLQEKYAIYLEIPKDFRLDKERWLSMQCWITIKYYILSYPKKFDLIYNFLKKLPMKCNLNLKVKVFSLILISKIKHGLIKVKYLLREGSL